MHYRIIYTIMHINKFIYIIDFEKQVSMYELMNNKGILENI